MILVKPQIVILDSSTLVKVSHDYWSQDPAFRNKARSFITQLKNLGVYVTFTLTHICELLRHENEQKVWNRLNFLHSIPLIAWLRPYSRSWFPGSITDLLSRELHVVVHGSARNWQEIVNEVRPELWETGVGSDMFVENYNFWSIIKRECKIQHETEKYVASVDRTDPGRIRGTKISDALRLPIRPKEEHEAYMLRFAQEMQRQLERHGDKRFDYSYEAAIDFSKRMLKNINDIDEKGRGIIQKLLPEIPDEFVSPEMTIGELGELAIYAKQLEIISSNLNPPIKLTMRQVPPDTLPSFTLERKLASIQRKAERVSGSNLGDRHIAPLISYTDGIEVDKRTYEFLKQVQRNEPKLASLMGRFFRSSDYSQIPGFLEKLQS